jgi:cell wall-associated NlpC family hydrolase
MLECFLENIRLSVRQSGGWPPLAAEGRTIINNFPAGLTLRSNTHYFHSRTCATRRPSSGPGRLMRRTPALIFSFAWLLASCQAGGRSPATLIGTTEPLLPSGTIASTGTATPAAVPSETPESTSPSPTSDPREYVVNARKASVWDAPENEKKYWNLQTQLILGEKVLVIDRLGEWSKIAAVEQPSKKDPLGYPGWVRSESLAQGWPTAQRYAVVMTPYGQLRTEPGGTLLLSVYLDTRLPVESAQEDWVQVRLPDGQTGWLASNGVRLTDDLSSPVPTDGLFALAQGFIGIPYWWGGTTSDSFDCSGFLYRIFHAYGIDLGRDSNDQASGGEPVAREDLKKGDLIFTSKTEGGPIFHAAMYWGNNTVLDADAPAGVAVRSLPGRLQYEYWITARRYLP